MHFDRRSLIAAVSLAGLGAIAPELFASAELPTVYRVADPAVILKTTRALITNDSIGTFITLDASSQPRARSVFINTPDDDLTIWIGTRRGSRKLAQIAANPSATLHFADDSKNSYLSLMGEAHAQTDPAVIKASNPYKGVMLTKFFPHFPEDFALISFKPKWLELMTDTLPGLPATWQPQGLIL